MAHKAEIVGSRARAAGRRRDRQAWSPAWGAALIAVLLLVLSTACSVRAVDPLGIEAAVEETRLAVDGMTGALIGLPPAVRDGVAAEVRLIAEAAHRALDGIEMQPMPVVDPELAHDLSFLADVARTTAGELQHAATVDGGRAGDPLLGRIAPLLGAADARLGHIEARLDRWIERTEGAVVEIESERGVLVVRSTDRMVHGAVRYVSLGLLLVGVLLVGLRLLRMSEERSDAFTLFADRPVISSLAVLALGVFFVISLAFTISPGTLAALSAEIEQQPSEPPCLRLERQRAHLASATAIGHAGLVDAIKQRMAEPARDCLGLASQSSAEEAVERLASRTGIGESSARLTPAGAQAAGRHPSVALGRAPETTSTATHDRLVATAERIDRTIRQGATESLAGERAAKASSAERRGEGPPKPALRPAPPRERVTTAEVNYRSGPKLDAGRLGTLPPGTRVTVLADANGWTEIRLRDGRKAFVASRFLRPTP